MPTTISAAAFASIVRCLRADPGSRAEQRQSPRVGLSGSVTIIPCASAADRKPVTVQATDLSHTGIGLTRESRMTSGEQFILHLPGDWEEPAKAILCTVTHWRPAAEKMFTIGAKFLREIELPKTSKPAFEAPACDDVSDEQVRLVQERIAQAHLD